MAGCFRETPRLRPYGPERCSHEFAELFDSEKAVSRPQQTNKQTNKRKWNSVPGIQRLLWERYSFSFRSWRKGWKRRRKLPRNVKMRDRRPAGGRRARGLGNKRPLLDLLGYFFFFLEKILHRPLYSRRRLVSKLFTGVTNLIELQIHEATWMLSHVASI